MAGRTTDSHQRSSEFVTVDEEYLVEIEAEHARYRAALERITQARGYNGASGSFLKGIAREALNDARS